MFKLVMVLLLLMGSIKNKSFAGEVLVDKATITKQGKVDIFLKKFANKYGDITITSGHRDKHHKLYRKGSYHSKPGKARDIRTWNLSKAVIEKLIQEAYKAGFTVIDERSRKSAPHIHIDDRGKASIMKWNNKIKDAVKIK
jgi:hypothetical protein